MASSNQFVHDIWCQMISGLKSTTLANKNCNVIQLCIAMTHSAAWLSHYTFAEICNFSKAHLTNIAQNSGTEPILIGKNFGGEFGKSNAIHKSM